ncbi:hypothetical protein BA195_13845 [Tenacibaculum soleae]|uniref:DUF1579 domain-containing protein n=1 Tax=Tenacibaculum soleae TaxID=447689 RepID=A0A1B9XYQ6_9FLAO|nr:hypothetical protein BA195_13845 [Tenacibaculum soleae]
MNFSCISAQEITLKKGMTKAKIQKGTYYKTDHSIIKKFIGIWEGNVGGKKFKLKIFKEKVFLKGSDIYMDVLNGLYCFENCNFENPNAFLSKTNGTFEMYEKGKIEFMINDFKYKKLANVNFEILENNTAKWTLFYTFSNKDKPKGFTIPKEMLLKKTNQ